MEIVGLIAKAEYPLILGREIPEERRVQEQRMAEIGMLARLGSRIVSPPQAPLG